MTGKVDPSGRTPHGAAFDMDRFRADVAAVMNGEDDALSWTEKLEKWQPGDDNPKDKLAAGTQLNQARGYAAEAYRAARRAERAVEALAKALGPEVHKAVQAALEDAVIDVDVTVNKGGAA